MSDTLGSAPTQEFPRIKDDAGVTQEIPRVTAPATGPAYEPLPSQGWTRPAPSGNRGGLMSRIRNSPAWVAPAALAACFASAAAFVVVTDPTDDVGPTTCAFKLVTGFDCPGCGGTRAFFYLLHGNIPEAARNHVIALFAAPFLVWLYLTWAGRRIFPKLRDRVPQFRITAVHASWFLGAWAAFWVIRNIPFAPFTSLYV
ncbi:MAG: DUF2752 domain-containing protein [Stackebrandtia sp.]